MQQLLRIGPKPMGKTVFEKVSVRGAVFLFWLSLPKHGQQVVNTTQMHMKHDTWHIRYRQYPVASETLPFLSRQFVYTSFS